MSSKVESESWERALSSSHLQVKKEKGTENHLFSEFDCVMHNFFA